MAVLAYRLWRKHRDRQVVRDLLPMCVVQVTRPAMQGWPEEYGEAHGVTWLPETRNGSDANRAEPAPASADRQIV